VGLNNYGPDITRRDILDAMELMCEVASKVDPYLPLPNIVHGDRGLKPRMA
jgi:hypothetical protein